MQIAPAALLNPEYAMMDAVQRVEVRTESRPYAVEIEEGLLLRSGERIRELFPDRSRFFVITTPPIKKHWGSGFSDALNAATVPHQTIEIGDGERYKNLNTIEELADKLIRRGADRQSVFIALGGGVVGDITGFIASIYMRGVDFVQVPTTLVAQVDASIGGKTAVDLKAGKNLVGTFYHPWGVLVDPGVLSTLPEREYRSGLYEALKCGIIRNPEIFTFMEDQRTRILQRDPSALEWLIAECVRVKADVVSADEREAGLRRILNFGHTIGHALEAETGYKQFLHGEAVAWGMVAASMIAAAMQRTDADTARRIISTVLAYAPLPKVETRGKKIISRLKTDKKTTNGVVHFILPLEIGRVEVVPDIPERAVVQAIDELRYLSQA
ncbi:MAG TPA: 3-dehydroquinate synthase [Terriglobales bacterium]|nr:3-dehydroquinate synthase [Terriglobales bacterium]